MLEQAFRTVVTFLEEHHVSYMVIGGIANSVHGIARQTFAIDIKIEIDTESLDAFIQTLGAIGDILPENPVDFAEATWSCLCALKEYA